MADYLLQSGFNVVSINHVGVQGMKGLRLMNFCKQKYMDEVLQFSDERFSNEKPCDVFLFGFSLGGNHCLRYKGAAAKNKLMDEVDPNDQSNLIKGVVSVSNPFDVL